jgi:hypothetical protein
MAARILPFATIHVATSYCAKSGDAPNGATRLLAQEAKRILSSTGIFGFFGGRFCSSSIFSDLGRYEDRIIFVDRKTCSS